MLSKKYKEIIDILFRNQFEWRYETFSPFYLRNHRTVLRMRDKQILNYKKIDDCYYKGHEIFINHTLPENDVLQYIVFLKLSS